MNNLETAVFVLNGKFIPENNNFNRGISITAKDIVSVPRKDGSTFDTKEICYNRKMGSIFTDDWNVPDVEKTVKSTPKIDWPKQPEFYVDPKKQGSLVEFLRVSNQNGSNPNRDTSVEILFYELDRRAEASERVHGDRTESLAKAQAYEGDITKLREVVHIMGDSKKNRHGEPYTEDQIRDSALIKINQGRGEEFLEEWNNPSLQYKIVMNQAIDTGIVYLDENTGEVKWGDTGKSVKTGKIPYGRDWKDHIIGWISSSANGKTFFDEVQIQMSNGMSAEELSKKFGGFTASMVDEMSAEDLLDKAFSYNLIVSKRPFYHIDGKFDVTERITKSKKGLIEAIEENKEVNNVKLKDYIKDSLKIKLA